jgi:hypothetical protein
MRSPAREIIVTQKTFEIIFWYSSFLTSWFALLGPNCFLFVKGSNLELSWNELVTILFLLSLEFFFYVQFYFSKIYCSPASLGSRLCCSSLIPRRPLQHQLSVNHSSEEISLSKEIPYFPHILDINHKHIFIGKLFTNQDNDI